MEKISKAEQAQREGKVLNEDQLILLSSKQYVEKSISDFESTKSQLDEVFAKEVSHA